MSHTSVCALVVEITDEDREALDAIGPPGDYTVPYYLARFGPHEYRI